MLVLSLVISKNTKKIIYYQGSQQTRNISMLEKEKIRILGFNRAEFVIVYE